MEISRIVLLIDCDSNPIEYFCWGCGQLRYGWSGTPAVCGNCGCKKLITGHVGTLDKAALIKQFNGFRG